MIDYETLEMVCGEAGKALREVAREADMTKPGDAELVKNLVGIIYKADKLNDDEGISQDGNWRAEGSYRNGNSYDGGSSYARRGRHYVRAHYSRGNYYSRDGLMEHLDAAMQEADTDEQREKIRRLKEQLM